MRRSRARLLRGLLAASLAVGLGAPVFVAAANLLPNSSFEAGVDSRLAIGRWYVDGLPALQLDAADPVHGQYSLRIPYSRFAFTAAPRTTDGIEIRSAAAARLAAGQLYSLTAWVRSDVPVAGTLALAPGPPDGRSDVTPVASQEVSIGRKWRRIGLTFRSATDQDAYWVLVVRSERPGALWLDALQLEPGRLTPYAPGRPVEAGIAVPAEGAIFTAGDAARVTLTAFNGSAAPVSQVYRLAVLDLQGKRVHAEDVAIDLPAGAGAVRELRLPALRNGIYSALLTPGAGPGSVPESEAHLAVLPPRRDVATADGNFGAAATIAPEPLRILRRAGFTWLVHMTANGRLIYWDLVEPFPGKFIWYDEDVRLAESLGFGQMFNLEPCRTPAWARPLSKEQRIERWTRYVTAMATHYGSAVRHWTIADEVPDPRDGCWRTAEEYVPWHVAGARALRAADPGARVMLSVGHDWADGVLKALPPGSVDILADNAWHFPERMERWPALMARYGYRELWAPGVAILTPPWYAGHRGSEPESGPEAESPAFWAERNREVADGVVRTLAAGTRRLFQYTGTHVGNTNRFSLFEADSSLKPIGVQFASLIWLLDGAVKAGRVPARTGTVDGPVRAYRFERADRRVVYPLFGPVVAAQTLRLPGLAPADVALYDHFANPLGVRAGASGGLELPVGRDPVFLLTTREGAGRVDRALAGLTLRLDALPDAERVEQAGAYAILHGYRDRLWRPEPNVSLWYRSAARGWMELLRYRDSAELPTYRVTREGFEIDWRFRRGSAGFFLQPGQLPAELLAGATLFGSRPSARGLEWQSSRLDAQGGAVLTETVPAGPALVNLASLAGIRDPLTLLLQGREGLRVRLRTTLTGDPAIYGEQATAFGGWQLLARPGGDYFLHQLYRDGVAGPVEIRVRVDVPDPPDSSPR